MTLTEGRLANDDADAHADTDPVAGSSEPDGVRRDIALPTPCGRLVVNQNVFFVFAFAIIFSFTAALYNDVLCVSYVSAVAAELSPPSSAEHRNDIVGYITAVFGLSQALTALPLGYFADRLRNGRSRVIAFGGLITLVASLFNVALILYVGDLTSSRPINLSAFLAAYMVDAFLWGVEGGVIEGPVEALFADSTARGKRALAYTRLETTKLLSYTFGSVLCALWFQAGDDEWTIAGMASIILTGVALDGSLFWIMFLFDDEKSLPESEDAEEEPRGGAEDGETEPAGPRLPHWFGHRRAVPTILFLSDVVFSLGSGMTVKFFPLYFKNDVGMSPSEVLYISILTPLLLATAYPLAEYVSRFLGAVQTVVLSLVIGLAHFYVMIIFEESLLTRPYLLVGIYVVRTVFLNVYGPLCTSILMDHVPREERARWQGLSSITDFGWCGSAALGGVLADKYGYAHTFLITAIFQTVGTAGYCLLLPLVPRTREESTRENNAEEDPPSREEHANDLEVPLLS